MNHATQTDVEAGRVTDFTKFDAGNLCVVTGGADLGRTGMVTNRERPPGSSDAVHAKDANGSSFATGLSNTFETGKGNKPWISLPGGKGIRLTLAEERDQRLGVNGAPGDMIGEVFVLKDNAARKKRVCRLESDTGPAQASLPTPGPGSRAAPRLQAYSDSKTRIITSWEEQLSKMVSLSSSRARRPVSYGEKSTEKRKTRGEKGDPGRAHAKPEGHGEANTRRQA